MSFLKRFVTVLTLSLFALGPLAGRVDQADKDKDKGIGEDVKDAGRATKRAAKKTGRKVKKTTKKGINKAAGATEKGARKVEKSTRPEPQQ